MPLEARKRPLSLLNLLAFSGKEYISYQHEHYLPYKLLAFLLASVQQESPEVEFREVPCLIDRCHFFEFKYINGRYRKRASQSTCVVTLQMLGLQATPHSSRV
jgi:hypothetical protein